MIPSPNLRLGTNKNERDRVRIGSDAAEIRTEYKYRELPVWILKSV
jgi:hypothetical protein